MSIRVAALYVERGGVYWDIPDVDPWDIQRNALNYDGPYSVVAHPPCPHWSLMGQCRGYMPRDEDYATFSHALDCVRRFGGVLEHPAHSKAWPAFGLARPAYEGWTRTILDEGWTCEVDQFWYGHRANKRTWLYYAGPAPQPLAWGKAARSTVTVRSDGGGGRDQRSKTPPAFRDVLLDMARSASRVAA